MEKKSNRSFSNHSILDRTPNQKNGDRIKIKYLNNYKNMTPKTRDPSSKSPLHYRQVGTDFNPSPELESPACFALEKLREVILPRKFMSCVK